MKLENLKGQKLIEPIYFCFLREKFLFWGKFLKFSRRKSFLTFPQKLIHRFFLFYPKMVPKRVLCDSPKSTCLKKNLVLQCSIFWSSISLERIKWYLSYFSWSWSSSKGSIWKSSSLIRCCQVYLSCNQVAWFCDYQYLGKESSYFLVFYACSESSRVGSIRDYHFWFCVVS